MRNYVKTDVVDFTKQSFLFASFLFIFAEMSKSLKRERDEDMADLPTCYGVYTTNGLCVIDWRDEHFAFKWEDVKSINAGEAAIIVTTSTGDTRLSTHNDRAIKSVFKVLVKYWSWSRISSPSSSYIISNIEEFQ